jgi:hypothetical protein
MFSGSNHAYTTDRFGVSNSAISFNSGYYNLPNGIYFKGDFTISAWVYLINNNNNGQTIIDCGNGQSNNNVLFMADDGSNKPLVYTCSSTTSSSCTTTPQSVNVISNSVWHHMVYTLNGTVGKMYVEGMLINTDTSMNTPNGVLRQNNFVGKNNWGGSFDGYLDDLRIYNRTLSEAEVYQLYINGSIILTTPNTVTTSTSTTSTSTTSTSTTSTSTTSTSTNSSSTISTAASTTTVTLPSLLATLNTTFGFSQLTAAQSVQLLNSNYDLSGCIVNCSNHGTCKFDAVNNLFSCACDLYYSDKSCSTDLRQCSSNPCLNNSTCVDYSNTIDYNMTSIVSPNSTSTFYCFCNKYYQGTFCETKIDVCKNQTCSSHGNCIDKNSMPKCECFSMYQGDYCEIQSSELKAIQTIISITSVIAILTVVSFYSCIVFMDFIQICFMDRGSKTKLNKRQKIMNFIYYN